VNPPVFDRGRSERFAELLDDADGRRRRHRYSSLDTGLASHVRLIRRIESIPPSPDAGPEFRDGLRAMIMAKIAREGIGATAKQAVPPGRAATPGRRVGAGKARTAMLLGAVGGAVLLSGVSVASTHALPGNPLYQVKRSSERAQLALAGSDITRGQLYLQFAIGRLIEAEQVDKAMLDEAMLAEVFADMNAETQQGSKVLTGVAVQKGDPAMLNALLDFVRHQRTRILNLHLSQAGTPLVQASLQLLDAVELRANALSSSLQRGCDVGSIDSLGPVPGPGC
jgi:Domain of unknown function (DUF5667)